MTIPRRQQSQLGVYPASSIGQYYQQDERDLVDIYGMFAAPFFRLEISDQNDSVLFSAESQAENGGYDLHGIIVSDVEYDENDCQASMISLTVQNPDMQIHDERLFGEGNTIDLWMGYDGHTPKYMGRGIITEIEPMFESGTIPSMNVKAYDIAYFMMEEGRCEINQDETDWRVRNTVSVNSNTRNTRQRPIDNAIPNTEAQAQQDAALRIQNPNYNPEGMSFPEGSIDTAYMSGIDPSNTEIDTALIEESVDSPVGDQSGASSTNTSQWRQWRSPRSSRDSGKVWREMTDSEIVETIFHSYGIIPYTEATDESTRGSIRTIVTNNQPSLASDAVQNRDEDQARTAAHQTSIGLNPVITPNLSVDTNGATLDLTAREIHVIAVERNDTTTTTTVRGPGRRVVQKSGTSDWDFIKNLAKKRGYIVFVFFDHTSRRWIGYWGLPNNVPQYDIYNFKYNANDNTSLRSVRPRISMRGQSTEIDLSIVDPRNRREQRVRVSMESVSNYSPEFRGPDGTSQIREPLGNGPEVTLTIHGHRTTVIADRNITDPEDARTWLMAFWMKHAADFCTMEGDTIIGFPELRARHHHFFSGLGRIDGAFFITKTTHKMVSGTGYSTAFSAYRLVDLIEGDPISENNLMSVDDNALGQRNPESNG